MQVLDAPDARVVGLHTRLVTETGVAGLRLMVAVCEPFPRVAVMVADWLLATAPAVALNTAEVAPAATVTDGGTANATLVLINKTELPPAGAA